MRHQVLWVAAVVALAAGLHLNVQRAIAQQADTSADASADSGQAAQSNESTSSDAAGQAGAQSSAAQTDTSGSATAGGQSSQTGSAIPPPDESGQQQQSTAQSQDHAAQNQQSQPQGTPRQDQQQQQGQAQQSTQDQAVQGRADVESDARGQGQADIRDGARERDFRDRDFRDRGSRDVNIGIRFGVPTGRGLVIDMIDRNSVFFNSGLRRGDLLISLHGRPIRTQAEFVQWVHTHPGERIPVVVMRDGRQETVYITYDQQLMPQDHQVYRPVQPPVAGAQPFLGVMFDVQAPNAAIVRDVTPGSPAEHAGLRRGDMIVALNGQRVSSHQHAIQVIRMMRPGDQLMIDFSRRVTDQTQALLADRPGEQVRTATAPDYEQDVAPMPQPIYRDRPSDVPPGEFDRDPRMIDRERGVGQPLRDRPLLPRLRN